MLCFLLARREEGGGRREEGGGAVWILVLGWVGWCWMMREGSVTA